jgi:hypothetical protein
MLPVFLDCPVSCMPNVASISGLSFTQDTGQSRNIGNIGHTRYRTIQKYWQHWAHKIQDNPEILATLGTQDTGRRQIQKRKKEHTHTAMCKQTHITYKVK